MANMANMADVLAGGKFAHKWPSDWGCLANILPQTPHLEDTCYIEQRSATVFGFQALTIHMRNLQTLPIEIIQHIATHLPNIKDLLCLSSVSHKLYSAIQNHTTFRELFLGTYDHPRKCDNYNYKHQYSWRITILKHFLENKNYVFHTLQPRTQVTILDSSPLIPEMLEEVRELLFEASTKNFTYLRRFVHGVQNIIPTSPDKILHPFYQFLMALQLALTNVAAVERINWLDSPHGHVFTQALTYGNGDRALFVNDSIDNATLARLWATANFFLLHFNGRIQGLETQGLKFTFDELSSEERGAPSVWESNQWLDREVEMPKYWFGFYVYLDPEGINHLRNTPTPTLQEDHYEGKLTIMELTPTSTTFTGTGTDTDDFTVCGTITPLPPVFSIPHFRRITFSTEYSDDRWHYDGCLLPNSQTIIGRWTTHEDDDTTPSEGPFIMWAVNREDYEYEKVLREDEGKDGEIDDFLNL